MKVESLITFGGRCEEALEFYKKAIGAEVTALMRWKESPDAAMKAPPGYGEKGSSRICVGFFACF